MRHERQVGDAWEEWEGRTRWGRPWRSKNRALAARAATREMRRPHEAPRARRLRSLLGHYPQLLVLPLSVCLSWAWIA